MCEKNKKSEGGIEKGKHLTSHFCDVKPVMDSKTTGYYQELRLGCSSCDVLNPKSKEGNFSLIKILFLASCQPLLSFPLCS